jgi:hypothetical protein
MLFAESDPNPQCQQQAHCLVFHTKQQSNTKKNYLSFIILADRTMVAAIFSRNKLLENPVSFGSIRSEREMFESTLKTS